MNDGYVYYKCSKCEQSLVHPAGVTMRNAISAHNLKHQLEDPLKEFWEEFNEA